MKPIINPIWFYLLGIAENVGTVFLVFGILFAIAGAIIYFIHIVAAFDNEEIPKGVGKFKSFLWFGAVMLLIYGIIPTQKTGYAIMAATVVTPNNIEAVGETTTDIIDYIVESVDKLIEDNTVDEGEQ